MGFNVSEEITQMNYHLSVRNHFTAVFQGLLFAFLHCHALIGIWK